MQPQLLQSSFAAAQSGHLLVDAQRSFAAKYGPAALCFQDWIGLHRGKLAFFVTRAGAEHACAASNLFEARPRHVLKALMNGVLIAASLDWILMHKTIIPFMYPFAWASQCLLLLLSGVRICSGEKGRLCDEIIGRSRLELKAGVRQCSGKALGNAGGAGAQQGAQRQGRRMGALVRARIPRIPLFLLPSQFWLPHHTGTPANSRPDGHKQDGQNRQSFPSVITISGSMPCCLAEI